ncbi:GRIP1-associated protein 1 [Cricetulus griseus]|uniref:GRIP1-associated protein 1 n=1 Tax=Cricetulus griseus TaxID=10029 RepID=G3HNC4_CRIGR|nr:GRIP1-associated protein 1 [Cricetulus griseus]
MQTQLLELRTNNYQLSDELRKNGVELASLRQKVAYLDKEFTKAQKALSKSKKAQVRRPLVGEYVCKDCPSGDISVWWHCTGLYLCTSMYLQLPHYCAFLCLCFPVFVSHSLLLCIFFFILMNLCLCLPVSPSVSSLQLSLCLSSTCFCLFHFSFLVFLSISDFLFLFLLFLCLPYSLLFLNPSFLFSLLYSFPVEITLFLFSCLFFFLIPLSLPVFSLFLIYLSLFLFPLNPLSCLLCLCLLPYVSFFPYIASFFLPYMLPTQCHFSFSLLLYLPPHPIYPCWSPGPCLPLQEVEVLLSENEMLQAKLHSQEEDFRLQNSTLMAEFSKLCSQLEQLELENRQLKEGATGSHVDGELLRLQAENTALQKNVAALQERYEKETVRSSIASEGQGDLPGDIPSTALSPMPLAEVELKWEMEKEEKKLLWEQLQGLELSEKLKKKQERNKIEELQQRKEADLKAQLARTEKLQQELEAANQSLAELRDQRQGERLEHAAALRALQDQVSIQSADAQEQVEGLLAENNALRTSLAALEQIHTAKAQELNMLRDQTTELSAELQHRQAEYEDLMGLKDDLNSQLQESLRANNRLLEQLQEMGQEKEQLTQDLHEARKSAEKRKAMLDELAMESMQEKSQHKEELGAVRLRHEKEMLGVRARYERELRELHEDKKRQEEELRGQIREEKARTREMETLQHTVEELQAQVHSMDGAKGWFERRLKEAEESLQQQQQEQEEALKQCREEHAAELKGKEEELQDVRDQLQRAQEERDGHVKTISSLKQEVKDTVDGQRILEKKGSAALKDLKRQLHLERKRADKLQERLQDILTNSKSRSGLEELVLSEMNSPSRTQTGDSSSVSSFSYREILKEKESSAIPARSLSSSPQAQPPRPAELSDEEVAELFQRLAETQQEKWMLEEKVKHLEVSSASMAEDLCRKSAIIETYVMDSRIDVSVAAGHTDRTGLGSVLRDLVKPGDENLREMNKKLQNMLEEQLTKNMHLHKASVDYQSLQPPASLPT